MLFTLNRDRSYTDTGAKSSKRPSQPALLYTGLLNSQSHLNSKGDSDFNKAMQ